MGGVPVPESNKKKKKKSMVVHKGEMRQEWDKSKHSNEKRKSEM